MKHHDPSDWGDATDSDTGCLALGIVAAALVAPIVVFAMLILK